MTLSAARAMLVLLLGLAPAASLAAQGVTSAGVRGTVSGLGSGTAIVRVRHEGTGFQVEVQSRRGQFLVQGLQPGGPYTISVRSIGAAPVRLEAVTLALGELRDIHFEMKSVAASLDTLSVLAAEIVPFRAQSGGGTGMTIGASMLDHLPTLNRDMYDFVKLVPQVSTKIGLPNPGISAGGAGFRFNEFLIDGVSERTLSGGVSTAFAGARSIPLDAVQEYQVLLAPYDVRYGDFAGTLINTVTKSGTNAWAGSVFAQGRNNDLARQAATSYERAQYGLSLGGPIIRDRLHFFVASELQDFTSLAAGPWVGQAAGAEQPVPVSASDLARFDTIMNGYGLVAGSAGRMTNTNPLRNVFARMDVALPAWNSRLIATNNYGHSEDLSFTRATRDTFSLSSTQLTRRSTSRTSALHLHTAFARGGGAHNELLVAHRMTAQDPLPAVQQPAIRVSVPRLGGGGITLGSGTPEQAQGSGLLPAAFRPLAVSVRDDLTLRIGAAHVATVGLEVQRFRILRGGAAGTSGAWSFASLDAFERGQADRYDVTLGFDNPGWRMTGMQYAAHLGDEWRANGRLTFTGGVRGNLLAIDGRAPYQPAIDSIFARRTDRLPRRRVELSPRLGFVWNASDAGTHRVRGGAGIFTGSYPLGWAHSALSSWGLDSVVRCRANSAIQRPPAFSPDHLSPPRSCAGGVTSTTANAGDVNVLDPELRMARVARSSLAYERRLRSGLVVVNEIMASRGLSDFVFVNLNLPAPVGTDPAGRVMYGTLAADGAAVRQPRSGFAEVIDVRNTSANSAYQLSSRLERTGANGLRGSLGYTFSRVRDVQTLLRVGTRGTAAWSVARVISGAHENLGASRSSNDVPHRIVATATYAAPWQRWRTEVSAWYVGESGRPFTYTTFGTRGRGDLNADGSNANDPVFVPMNVLDASDILFSGFSDSAGADNSAAAQSLREQEQRTAFESFVDRTSCLRRQRGRILERNSCREPWSNTTMASVRQAIPLAGRHIEMQLDVFNLLNLLNSRWGQYRQAEAPLLEHVGQITSAGGVSRPLFNFSGAGWTTVPEESSFQLQLGVRYRF